MENTLFDRVFKDEEGKVVLGQMPNLPVIVWVTASVLQAVTPAGKIDTGLEIIAFGAGFTWAWEELFQGVNYFRRALGLFVLVALVASKIQ